MTALSFFRKMQDAMDEQAVEAWNMVEYSRASGYRLRLGKVTATELIYYHLRHFWTKGVYINTNVIRPPGIMETVKPRKGLPCHAPEEIPARAS